MQPISQKNSKSLAISTLLMLAVIVGVLYLQISTEGSSVTKVVSEHNNPPVTKNIDDKSKIIAPTSSNDTLTIQPKSINIEQQESNWQPSLSVAEDVKSATTKTQITTLYQHTVQSNIFSYQYQQTTERNLDALQFNPYLGVEADYANLSSNHAGQESIDNNVAETQYRQSDDAAAVFVNIIGTFDFDQSSALFAKIGINAWEINDNQLNAMSTSPNDPSYQTNMNADSSIGTDIFYGVGFTYDWNTLIVKTEYQIIELNGEQYKVYSIGGTIRF